jgi:hypothetical protein
MTSPLVLDIPRRGQWPVTNYREASDLYCSQREQSGLGSSEFPGGTVLGADIPFARISYNGRVWPVEPWHPGMVPLYDNRSQEA